MNGCIALSVAFLLLPWHAVAQEITATMLEGKVWVIRGAGVLPCAEGMRLRQGDILESKAPGFAQLEFHGGTIAAIGPASRVYLFRAGASGADVVLLSGWLKSETAANGSESRYNTAHLGAATKDGTFVLHAAQNGAEVFVESGAGTVAEVSAKANLGHTLKAKSGEFFTRKSGKNVVTSDRPDPAFLEAMPPAFRDTFPSRLSRFQGKKPPEPRVDHEVSYAEIQPWLTMGQAWRAGFVKRFKTRLKDPEFRRGVEEHLSEHPEWDVILHPEKYPDAKQGGY